MASPWRSRPRPRIRVRRWGDDECRASRSGQLSGDARELVIVGAIDRDFVSMLAGGGLVRGYLRQPPGGVDEPGVLAHVRRLAARHIEGAPASHWLMVVGGEIVGLCGFIAAPTADGEVEIGYGVAAARRNRGYASAAVAAVIAQTRHDPQVRTIIASTVPANHASQRVLAYNGFHAAGTRDHPKDGPLLLWRKDL